MRLINIPFQGGTFTWSNGQSLSRIDRFLLLGDWEEHFAYMIQTRLLRPVSDHWPLLLDSRGTRRGLTPFRFENMWLQFDGFLEVVRGWWTSYVVTGSPSCRLAQKLKLLKGDLKRWNKEVFGRLEVQKAEVMALLHSLDKLEAHGGLLANDVVRKEVARQDYVRIPRMKGVTEIQVLIDNAHRWVNQINRLQVDGRDLGTEGEIQERIVSFYQYLFRPQAGE
ncbi:hypothetical protein ACSBR1_043165 [Camellia fascicularis]